VHSLDLDRLADLAAEVIGEDEAAKTIRRLRRMDALQRLDEPLLLLIGGTTGTGKSTIATEVAHRLGIRRVTSTDFIRQTMRAFFSEEFMPSVHYSSFDARLALTRAEEEESGDAALLGFLDQTRHVLVGVQAALERASQERWSMVLEGVHLVPGMMTAEIGRAFVVPCVIAIEDENLHRSHFWVRDYSTEGLRPLEKYLDSLPQIREIQEYLIERARRHDIPVIVNDSLERAIGEVMDLVLRRADQFVAAV
jgi:2-phosphoglycerate kinase